MTSPRAGQLVGQLCLGWQYATPVPAPGPPPRRPTPPDAERLSPDWAAVQRREESLLNRPLKAVFGIAVVLGLTSGALGAAGRIYALPAGLGALCGALIAGVSGYAIWQGERALRARMADERARVGRVREAQESRLFTSQAEHAAQVREWQVRQQAYEQQKRWYAVRMPEGVHRADIVGGTLSGWSALLTTAGASRLAAGGEVTVVDLTGGAAALDLIGFARSSGASGASGVSGADPLVWVLPGDLPRLDLGTGLGREALTNLLSAVASVTGEPGTVRNPSLDRAILERVIDTLGGRPTIAGAAAGLRSVAQAGDPVVRERAQALESQLRKLAPAGTGPVVLPRSELRVIALSQRVGEVSSRVLGTFLAAALTELLRDAQPGPPWQRTLFVLGADKLSGDTLDRLGDACDRSATGLVLAYRGIPAHVRTRLGRGHAVVAVMRPGSAEDAAAASEQLGTGHRFELSQLTETIGASVADPAGRAYTSTAGAAAPAAANGKEAAEGDPVSTSTAWGMATAKAADDGDSLAQALRHSRELLAEPHELQRLPASAMIIAAAGPGGRRVVLADVNPGLGALGAATQLTLEEYRARPPGGPPDPAGPADLDAPPPGAAAPSSGPDRPGPNLGPPPRRLDWRRGQS